MTASFALLFFSANVSKSTPAQCRKVSGVTLKGSDIAMGLHPARHLFLCKPIIDAKIGERQSQDVLLFST